MHRTDDVEPVGSSPDLFVNWVLYTQRRVVPFLGVLESKHHDTSLSPSARRPRLDGYHSRVLRLLLERYFKPGTFGPKNVGLISADAGRLTFSLVALSIDYANESDPAPNACDTGSYVYRFTGVTPRGLPRYVWLRGAIMCCAKVQAWIASGSEVYPYAIDSILSHQTVERYRAGRTSSN